jgi:predicted nucleic acid-binding Zn ribbon protein
MTSPNRRGPEPLSDILGALYTARGYGRLQALGELEAAWSTAVGDLASRQTRVGPLRHGVLTVTVAHSALLEELAAFRKAELLARLKRDMPGTAIRDIRFRVGPVDAERETENRLPKPGTNESER